MSENTFSGLRTKLDGQDGFVGGHQIIDTQTDARRHGHGAARHAARMRKVPAWALNDEKIKQFIKSRYPNADTNEKQRLEAGRTVRLIYLYYRVGATRSVVAEELKITKNAVKHRVHKIAKGMEHGVKSTGRGGRPRKPRPYTNTL